MPVVIKTHSFGHLQEFYLTPSPDLLRKTVDIERVKEKIGIPLHTTAKGKSIPVKARPSQMMIPAITNAEGRAERVKISFMTDETAPPGEKNNNIKSNKKHCCVFCGEWVNYSPQSE